MMPYFSPMWLLLLVLMSSRPSLHTRDEMQTTEALHQAVGMHITDNNVTHPFPTSADCAMTVSSNPNIAHAATCLIYGSRSSALKTATMPSNDQNQLYRLHNNRMSPAGLHIQVVIVQTSEIRCRLPHEYQHLAALYGTFCMSRKPCASSQPNQER